MQRKSLLQRTHHVVAPMHNDARNVFQPSRIAAKLIGFKKGMIDEIVVLDARQTQGDMRVAEVIRGGVIGQQRHRAPLPHRPGLGRRHAPQFVRAGEQPMKSVQQIAAFILGNRRKIIPPVIRENRIRAILIKPVNIARAAEKNPAQNQAAHTLRMGFSIGQPQSAAPGAAEDQPFFNAQMLTDTFDVGHQIPGGVIRQFRMRRGTPATALIEQHDAIALRVEIAAMIHRTARPRPAVQKHHGNAVGIAAFLDVQGMQRADGKCKVVVRLNGRVEGAHIEVLRVSFV